MAQRIRKRFPFFRSPTVQTVQADPASVQEPAPKVGALEFDLAPDDPLLAYFNGVPGVVDIDRLEMDSTGLRSLKAAGFKLVAPLISQGELIGLLNLGPRRSEQPYSVDDKRLLNTLATQAAPALRVAQLARQQQIEARDRERLEQEMRVARVIQETLLPKETPDLKSWRLTPYWRPARAVSGDFYDFIYFPDGRLGIIVADVTDKGVPAALVMATARSSLRAAAERAMQPGEILRRANDQLCPDIPPKMFVTCLFILLDPTSGALTLANAGHNLPIWQSGDGIKELRATGMPLGLLPGSGYEEIDSQLAPGDRLLLYSDGIVEAHNSSGEMFSFPRLREIVRVLPVGVNVSDVLMQELFAFTGPAWEQEDDVTLLTIERLEAERLEEKMGEDEGWVLLADLSVPTAPGNERVAMEKVAEFAGSYGFRKDLLDRLKTAVAETTMNAMEHGNQFRPELPVTIQIFRSEKEFMVRITDFGGGKEIPEHVLPDLDAKLEGLQSPRGWGLFLIQNMVDEMRVHSDQTHHVVELVFRLEAKYD